MSTWPLSANPQFSSDMTQEELVAEVKRVTLHKGRDPIGFNPVLSTPEQDENMMKMLEERGVFSNKTLRDVLK